MIKTLCSQCRESGFNPRELRSHTQQLKSPHMGSQSCAAPAGEGQASGGQRPHVGDQSASSSPSSRRLSHRPLPLLQALLSAPHVTHLVLHRGQNYDQLHENLNDLLKAIHQAAVKLESESRSSRAHGLDLYPLLPVCGALLRETLMGSSPGTWERNTSFQEY